jgi:hypothetical protein
MFNDGSDFNDYEMRQRIRRMRHDIEHSERERANAIKHQIKAAAHAQEHAIKHALRGNMPFAGMEDTTFGSDFGRASPRSVDQIMDEIDSYISYLEDLPKEKVAQCEEKLDRIGEHLKNLKESLHK